MAQCQRLLYQHHPMAQCQGLLYQHHTSVKGCCISIVPIKGYRMMSGKGRVVFEMAGSGFC